MIVGWGYFLSSLPPRLSPLSSFFPSVLAKGFFCAGVPPGPGCARSCLPEKVAPRKCHAILSRRRLAFVTYGRILFDPENLVVNGGGKVFAGGHDVVGDLVLEAVLDFFDSRVYDPYISSSQQAGSV